MNILAAIKNHLIEKFEPYDVWCSSTTVPVEESISEYRLVFSIDEEARHPEKSDRATSYVDITVDIETNKMTVYPMRWDTPLTVCLDDPTSLDLVDKFIRKFKNERENILNRQDRILTRSSRRARM